MKFERLFLLAFLANYLVNNVAAAIASLIPAAQGSTSLLTGQYIAFVLLSGVVVGLITWWYLCRRPRAMALKDGAIWGVAGFVIAILTALVTGICGVLLQTGSLSQLVSVLPNFGPFLWQWTTLVMLGFWVIPAVVVGWLMQWSMKKPAPMMPPSPRPMI